MKVLFEQIKKAIVNCPKTKKRAKLEQCKKCDYGFEIRNDTHCLYNDPVGTCISSIGISLDDKEGYAVELKPEFGIPGMQSIEFPVKNGVIGDPVYISQSEGYYCKSESQQEMIK